MLNDISYHSKFGGSFPIAMSFIVDSFLKRGNIFKSLVRQDHISRLISYISDRDIFIKHNDNHMLHRIATRSTIGLEQEKQFVDAISSVVTDENLINSREILSESIENREPQFPKFYFIIYPLTLYSNYIKENPINLPQDYLDSINGLNKIFKKKYPNKKIEWRHSLATSESKLKTSKGISILTLSLTQTLIIQNLVEHSILKPISLPHLITLCKIDEIIVVNSLRTLINAGLIEIHNATKKEFENGLFEIKSSFYLKKIALADNWSPRITVVQDVSQTRIHAIKSIIVKIMKMSRIMRTQQLIEKTIQQTSLLFSTNIELVNNCIKQLIADDYLEQRDDKHLNYF